MSLNPWPRRLLVAAALAASACATAPDAGKLSEAHALTSQGDLPAAADAYEGAYANGCAPDKPSVPCRDALIAAADATLQSGRPHSAVGKYELALEQLPHDAESHSTIESRIAAAKTAMDRQREAAQNAKRCPVSIRVRESVGKRLSRSRAALSLDGEPIDLAKTSSENSPVYSGPLLAMEHELGVDFAYAGKSSLEGYEFSAASKYSFVCPEGQPLQIVVNLVASKANPASRGVEVKYEVQKAR
ncbi:MAG: hypothetical protein JST54_11495 [Deltaproteobacteria bacterium]|nr:hypothetical protein [Deltaproteobacteria bacterium]